MTLERIYSLTLGEIPLEQAQELGKLHMVAQAQLSTVAQAEAYEKVKEYMDMLGEEHGFEPRLVQISPATGKITNAACYHCGGEALDENMKYIPVREVTAREKETKRTIETSDVPECAQCYRVFHEEKKYEV